MTVRKRQEDFAYRIYVTDTLQIMNDSIAKMIGGRVMKYRFAELIEDKSKQEEQSAEEVIERISNKLDRIAEE